MRMYTWDRPGGCRPDRALGFKPVYDYCAGQQAGTRGAILVAGRWYCPSMPEPLINAIVDLHADRIDRRRGSG
ncbi:hypothetical protein [Streptomyces nigra]|uniref:Uncharacterized protein n=1 Tax=Streptomyces nigra TaxID=1827580 RepID=A0ABZ1IS73_9ACTN